jgi:hypothetical protein
VERATLNYFAGKAGTKTAKAHGAKKASKAGARKASGAVKR